MKKKAYPWGVIFTLFVIFFPVGIWLIVSKLRNEPLHMRENGKAMRAFGIISLVLGPVIFVAPMMFIEGDISENGAVTLFFALFFFTIAGIIFIALGIKYSIKGKRYSLYTAIVRTHGDGEIEKIAKAARVEYKTAVRDLQAMIDAGFFENAYINQNEGLLIVTRHADGDTVIPAEKEKKEKRTTKCPYCGAPAVTIVGEVTECEYCGSPL